VVEGAKSRGVQNGCLELSERLELRRAYLKGFVLASELNQGSSDESVSLDEDTKDSTSSKKGSNFRDSRRHRPVLNRLNSGGVGDSSFIGTDMSEDLGSRNSKKGFLPTEGSTISFDSLNESMNSLEMFPDESTNSGVLGDSLIRAIGEFVSSRRTFDGDIVGEGLSPVRNLGTKDMRDIAL
jgi:hypothetical protein